jgi:hypothetical protein
LEFEIWHFWEFFENGILNFQEIPESAEIHLPFQKIPKCAEFRQNDKIINNSPNNNQMTLKLLEMTIMDQMDPMEKETHGQEISPNL